MKEDKKVRCMDCIWMYECMGYTCGHPDNRSYKFHPIHGYLVEYKDREIWKVWNKDGYCHRFEKEKK